MQKTLISLSSAILDRLNEITNKRKRSCYVDSVIERHLREIEQALLVLSISGLSKADILSAIKDVRLSSLPVMGSRSRAMARQLPDINPLVDGDESVAYAISIIAEEYPQNKKLREKLNEK